MPGLDLEAVRCGGWGGQKEANQAVPGRGRAGTQGETCEVAWTWCALPLPTGLARDEVVSVAESRSRMVKSVGNSAM